MSSAYSNTALGDQATLDANRYGQFTPWQRQQLQPPSLVGSLILVVLAGAFVIPLCLFFLVQFMRGWLGGTDSLGVFNLIFLGLFLLSLVALLPLLLGPLRGLLRKMRLRRDLAEGIIAQEDGQVIFVNRAGYGARAAGGALHSIDGATVVDLPPGAYRFYYLPSTRRILSAERQALFEPGGPHAALLVALAQANGFSMDELDTNRLGHMSGRQRTRLVGRLVILGVIVVGLLIGSVWQIKLLQQSSPWGYLVLGGILALLLFMTYQRWLDLLEGRVAMLEGFVQSEAKSDGEDGYTYYYVLDRKRFTVTGVAYRALVSGPRYRLYYLPHSEKLVSIEPLP